MPSSPVPVTPPSVRVAGVLPASLSEGVLWLERLRRSGELDAIGDRLRVARRPGYAGIDAFVFLLLFFTARPTLGGLRGFAEDHAEWAGVLGAVGGRQRLMSASALSRLLDAVRAEELRSVGRWLLREATGAMEVLRSPAVQARDARGEAWHVFDYDPTREAFRHRDLARGGERPRADRRTEGLAAPGHRGRKRGEVILTQGMLIHQGSGVWLDATIGAGNGDTRGQLASAVEAVAETCAGLGHPVGRALVIADGEFGGVPSLTIAKESGVAFLTRLSRYELLDVPEVRARLAAADWEEVPDCDAGPRRIAADLGTISVPAGETTLRGDGRRYDPVEVRVVVSRYEDTGERRQGQRGCRIGDGAYETYAALGLDAAAWSAADLVGGYYRRCGQENRFAQADRELGVDVAFSFRPGGHLLALLCALFVWNGRIAEGVRRNSALPAPVQAARAARVVPAPVELREGPPLPEAHASLPDEPVRAVGLPTADVLAPRSDERAASGGTPGEPAGRPPVAAPAGPGGQTARSALDTGLLAAALAGSTFPDALRRRPGREWDPAQPDVVLVGGVPHSLINAEVRGIRGDLRFAARLDTGALHQVSITVPRDLAEGVQGIVVAARGGHTRRHWSLHAAGTIPAAAETPHPQPPPTARATASVVAPARRPHVRPREWLVPTPEGPSDRGKLAVHWPLFLPAAARRCARAPALRSQLTVAAIIAPTNGHPLIGSERPALRSARLTWAQRTQRRAAAAGTTVTLTMLDRRPTVESAFC